MNGKIKEIEEKEKEIKREGDHFVPLLVTLSYSRSVLGYY